MSHTTERPVVPRTWRWQPLDSLASVEVSTVDKKSYEGEIPVSLCNYTDVYYNDEITESLNFMEATASPDQVSRFSVRAGDVVITKDSETSDDIGRPSYIPQDLPGVIYGYHLAIYRPFDHRYGKFLRYVFDNAWIRAELRSRTPGVTRVGLNQNTLRHLRVPVPPLDEAQRIAGYLDRETAEIDALIEEQTDLLALLRERRSSLVDSSLSALGSARIPLKRCGSLSTGLTLGATYSEPVSSHPYIRVANVQAGRLDLSTIAEVEVPDRVAETRRLEPGDVLMTEGGDRDKLGRGALWSGEIEGALHQNHVFAFRCGPYLEPRFLVYVLEASEAREYFEATASQSTNLASTNSTLVKRFKIPHVPVHMQREVVDELESESEMLEVAGEEATQLIQLAEEHRVALISAAVTGQLDVTDSARSAVEQLQGELEVRV